MSPYRLMERKVCHIPIELKHHAYWAIKKFDFDMHQASSSKRLQLAELKEICNEAHKNAIIYKHRMKFFYDKQIIKRPFTLGHKVLLFNSHLYIFPSKLPSRWFGLFIVHIVFPHWAIEINNPKNGVSFKVNGQIFKSNLEYQPHEEDTEINLGDPLDLDSDFFLFFFLEI